MSLNSFMIPQPEKYLFTDDYRAFIESLLYFFRTSPNAGVLPLSPEEKHVYKFDLTGFLLDNNIPLSDHYLIMRINELENVHDLGVIVDGLIMPDVDLLRTVNSIYKSKMKK